MYLLNKYLEIFKKSCHGNLRIRKFPVIRKYLRIRNFPVVRKVIYGSVTEAGELGHSTIIFSQQSKIYVKAQLFFNSDCIHRTYTT